MASIRGIGWGRVECSGLPVVKCWATGAARKGCVAIWGGSPCRRQGIAPIASAREDPQKSIRPHHAVRPRGPCGRRLSDFKRDRARVGALPPGIGKNMGARVATETRTYATDPQDLTMEPARTKKFSMICSEAWDVKT